MDGNAAEKGPVEGTGGNRKEEANKPINNADKDADIMNNTDSNIVNRPLTPGAIPAQEFPPGPQPSGAHTMRDPLSFRPLSSGPLAMLKLPGIIIFGMFVAYYLGRRQLNIVFLLVLCHIVYYAFRRRVAAYRRSIEALAADKARRESLGAFESVEWMNYIIRKFWEVGEASISSQIYSEVNKVLKANTPKMLSSLKLSELTLGTRPPVVEKIGFVDRNEDSVLVEFAMNFIPLQADEDVLFYFGDEKKHWNTCIELAATVGFIRLPLLVRNFTFSGMFRAEILLSHRIPFIKRLNLCMLELPLVDFELQPLKVVDFMDLPYLSQAIQGIIRTVISGQLLHPKQLSVDLSKVAEYRGVVIGVLYVHLEMLHSSGECSSQIELSIDGQAYASTASRTGSYPIFNEGFYEIVSDTTRNISLLLSSGSDRFTGKLSLRNLNRHIYNERLCLGSDRSRRFLDVSARFYRVVEQRTSSAIITMTLVSINDLQQQKDPVNRLYSTYCRITLESKESLRMSDVIRTFETKRIFSTKDPFYNESVGFFVKKFSDFIVKIAVVDDKTDREMGTVVIPLVSLENNVPYKYKIAGVADGSAEVKFAMKYIDLKESIQAEPEYPTAASDDEEELVTKEVEGARAERESMPGEYRGGNRHDLLNKQKIRRVPAIEPLNLGIYNTRAVPSRIVSYARAYKFTIREITDDGIFYLIFETANANWKMEPFSTDLEILRHAIVPVTAEEDCVRVRLFKMLFDGDALISEEWYNLTDTVLVFDTVRIELSVKMKELTGCDEPDGSMDVKIVQFKLDEFTKTGDYTIDVTSDNTTVSQKLPVVNTFAVGNGEVECVIRNKTEPISTFKLPVKTCEEPLALADGLDCRLTCRVQKCPFEHTRFLDRGILEVCIMKALNVEPRTADGRGASSYVKVYLDDDKIFKTNRKDNDKNPAFNGIFRTEVTRTTQDISFQLCEYSSFAPSAVLCYKEFSLLNLPMGSHKFTLQMTSAETGKPCGTVLHVLLNFINLKGEGAMMAEHSG